MLTRLLWRLSRRKSGLSKWLRDECALYLDYYNDFGYEFEQNGERELILKLARQPLATVFDVGANVGDWSIMASKAFPGASIHAFELSEGTRATLKRNLSRPCFVIPDCALGARSGEIEYKDYGENSIVNTLVNTTVHDTRLQFQKRKATIVTGDTYMTAAGIEKVDFLKIDVEGAEFDVLEGFRDALQRHAIRAIQFEYGYANGDAGHLMKEFHALLTAAGYEVGKIWTAGVRFAPFEYRMNNFDLGPNYLAVARSERELIDSLRSAI